MPSLRARLISFAVRRMVRRDNLSREESVTHFRKALDRPPLPTLGLRGIERGSNSHGGITCDEMTPPHVQRTLLYIHGGGFVAGRPATYHNLCGRLAKQLDARVVLPDYRLAPEHPYPAQLEDCLAVYRALIESGTDPKSIVVAGDSAGGSLTLALLLALRDGGEPLSACAICLSPTTDATLSGASMRDNADSDAMLSPKMIEHAQAHYLQGTDPRTPFASPLWADFTGLPPLFMTTSESEALRDDCLRAADRAREAGVPMEVLRRADMPHVWPVFVPVLPEARQDLKRMVGFVRSWTGVH